ncbi:elongation factor 1-gamma 3 [Stylonychia lemnae]|uniref:Elongation factor 1-gamma 3 n=1 Tax=Stylonychia lemnae TaxID=5949 RepID=A0A077ZXT1_STYLE|nr:elongation factor 1-gamma 3 [Stylonychia lemnae]|eukprot:CDW74721.1 elongation factor 1-gamma 3 [Stylonychia lemnae]
MKLYTTERYGNTHADLCFIMAYLSGTQVEEVNVTLEEFKTLPVAQKVLTPQLPALELDDGTTLTSSLAIAKFLASAKPDLLGSTLFEEAQIDQWLQVLRNETQPIARVINYQVYGHLPADQNEHNYIYNLLKDNLKLINNNLKAKSHFVGNHLTIVDIYFTLIQLELQQATMDTNFRNSMSNLNNHFKTIIALPEFRSRMGAVKQGKKQLIPLFDKDAGSKDLNKAQKKENSKQKAKQ